MSELKGIIETAKFYNEHFKWVFDFILSLGVVNVSLGCLAVTSLTCLYSYFWTGYQHEKEENRTRVAIYFLFTSCAAITIYSLEYKSKAVMCYLLFMAVRKIYFAYKHVDFEKWYSQLWTGVLAAFIALLYLAELALNEFVN